MRVHNPRLGELVDRLTILALKIKVGELKAVDVSHFQEEQLELLKYGRERFPDLSPDDLAKLLKELGEINLEIWQRIDLAHDFEMPAFKYAALSRNIVRLNDIRAAKIQEINGLSGMEKI